MPADYMYPIDQCDVPPERRLRFGPTARDVLARCLAAAVFVAQRLRSEI
jgi:hypothetical protein